MKILWCSPPLGRRFLNHAFHDLSFSSCVRRRIRYVPFSLQEYVQHEVYYNVSHRGIPHLSRSLKQKNLCIDTVLSLLNNFFDHSYDQRFCWPSGKVGWPMWLSLYCCKNVTNSDTHIMYEHIK